MANLDINLTSSQIINLFLKVNRETLFTNSWITNVSSKKSAGVMIKVIDNLVGEGEIEFRIDREYYNKNKAWILHDLKQLEKTLYYKFPMQQKSTGKKFMTTIRFFDLLSEDEDSGRRYIKLSYSINELR